MTPVLQFQNDAAEVTLAAVRQDAPPKLVAVCYEIITDSLEIEQRLQLFRIGRQFIQRDARVFHASGPASPAASVARQRAGLRQQA